VKRAPVALAHGEAVAGELRVRGRDRVTACARAWGLWARLVFAVGVAVAWPFVVAAPGRGAARALARNVARAILRLARMPVRTEGLERLARARRPCVLVANHASEIDALVLAAALPAWFGFVAKIELSRSAWLRIPLAKLGTLFVHRAPSEGGPSDTERAIERVRGGDSLLFFPEGTFRRRRGLLPFHRGAFVAAAAAGAPIVPVALIGTRAALPDGGSLPRRVAITVIAGEAIEPPSGDVKAAALALRHVARRFIAERCGEPAPAR
jgi:1-acyl-sn-glycerol-3-phosphate acyltransferase